MDNKELKELYYDFIAFIESCADFGDFDNDSNVYDILNRVAKYLSEQLTKGEN